MDVLGGGRAGRGGRCSGHPGGDRGAPHGGPALSPVVPSGKGTGHRPGAASEQTSTVSSDAAPGGEHAGADVSARERILTAAQDLFAERGFDATPTSSIAERAAVPKGLVHYYFRRKADLLVALVDRLPREHVDHAEVVVVGDVAASLRRLVAALDAWLDASPLLSHLLWREADTHDAVREALAARFRWMVGEIRTVMLAALPESRRGADVASAAELLALAISYRHATARHVRIGPGPGPSVGMDRELDFIADALLLGAGSSTFLRSGPEPTVPQQ